MSDVVGELKAAVVGVTYPSETDAAFEVVEWPVGEGDARQAVQTNGDVPAGANVDAVTLEDFFGELEGEEYVRLRKVLERLAGVSAVRVGEVRVVIYVVGRDGDGKWVGVRTVSVET